MNKETILNIFNETVNDYSTYGALYHMFETTAHDIVCVNNDVLFFRIPGTNKIVVGNHVFKYEDVCEVWKQFTANLDAVSLPDKLVNNSLLIREGGEYFFYKHGEGSSMSFTYEDGDITNVTYQCTFADAEKLNEKGNFRISSRFNYFNSFDVHIGAMKNDIVKMCTI